MLDKIGGKSSRRKGKTKMKCCYFTATGNSLYVAKRIGGETLSIPQLMKQDKIIIKDEVVGVICPVYGGQMPKMVRRFLTKAQIKTKYFFFINTYGMSDSVAKANAVAEAEKAGIKVSYVNSIKMVDNFLPGFEIQNQIATVGEKKIDEHLDMICRDIEARKVNAHPVGVVRKAGLSAINAVVEKAILKDTAAKGYIVNDTCILCGTCAKVCPAGNIKVANKVIFGNHCEDCYACLHACPKNAIHLKKERSSARFRNEHVTLKEIIEAND